MSLSHIFCEKADAESAEKWSRKAYKCIEKLDDPFTQNRRKIAYALTYEEPAKDSPKGSIIAAIAAVEDEVAGNDKKYGCAHQTITSGCDDKYDPQRCGEVVHYYGSQGFKWVGYARISKWTGEPSLHEEFRLNGADRLEHKMGHVKLEDVYADMTTGMYGQKYEQLKSKHIRPAPPYDHERLLRRYCEGLGMKPDYWTILDTMLGHPDYPQLKHHLRRDQRMVRRRMKAKGRIRKADKILSSIRPERYLLSNNPKLRQNAHNTPVNQVTYAEKNTPDITTLHPSIPLPPHPADNADVIWQLNGVNWYVKAPPGWRPQQDMRAGPVP